MLIANLYNEPLVEWNIRRYRLEFSTVRYRLQSIRSNTPSVYLVVVESEVIILCIYYTDWVLKWSLFIAQSPTNPQPKKL